MPHRTQGWHIQRRAQVGIARLAQAARSVDAGARLRQAHVQPGKATDLRRFQILGKDAELTQHRQRGRYPHAFGGTEIRRVPGQGVTLGNQGQSRLAQAFNALG